MRIEPVEATLREAVTLLTSGGQHADIKLSFGLSPDADFMLADRIQVQQVVVNLLRNAFEALATSPDGARGVLIEARLNKAALVEISICDNGPGLPDAILSRMFTPFTSSKGEGGMGFGLSICRRIVEAHGGELVGFNAPGGGACFRFTVPHVCLE
jgi:two-component system sensor kinase FixL